MRNILFIGLGGFIGAISRYFLSGWIQTLSRNTVFPWGTIGVNVLGCFVIGVLGSWNDKFDLFSSSTRLFIFIGLLGGFTTFSTFGYETLAFLRDGEFIHAALNMTLHLFLGLGAVWLGYSLAG